MPRRIALTRDELRELAADLESDRVERKESLSSGRDRIAEAICAFANDLPGRGLPGVLLVGVSDDGAPTGLPITDQLLQTLGAFRSDGNLLPLPTMAVEKMQLDGTEIAVVTVVPSADPPVRFRGRVWIRVGPRRAVASRDEERILVERRRAGASSFDARGVPLATLSDLDLDAFRTSYLPSAVDPETLEANQRDIVDQLRALHLAAPDGTPNAASLILLGRDPRAFIPGAYIQFARFDGTTLSDPILDQKEISGTVAEVLRRADDIVAANIRIATALPGAGPEERHPDYPPTALQQVLRNAVLHRSYETHSPAHLYWFSDRVEVHSPGGLFGRVTESNFGEPYATDYRNPVLAEGMKILGFVQRFGMGIQLARSSCASNGNPRPRFDFSPAGVLCTIERRS